MALWARFDDDHEQLRQDLEAEFRELICSSPPPELFHYTSSAMEIIESNRLRATDLRYTNDYSEIDAGLTIFHHALQSVSCKSVISQKTIQIAKESLPLRYVQDFRAMKPHFSVFAFCFCKGKDVLSQWRSYAAEGTGHVLGFDTSQLVTGLQSPMTDCSLRKVVYRPRSLSSVFKNLIRRVCECADRHADLYPEPENSFWHNVILFRFTLDYVVSFKKNDFAAEQEWRLVTTDFGGFRTGHSGHLQTPIHFRRSKHQIVPYVELKPKPKNLLPLTRVILGPQTDEYLGPLATDRLLYENGYGRIPVTRSALPLRNF